MAMTAIIIPTLDTALGADTGKLAQLTAGCPTRLIVVSGPARGFTATVNDGLRQLQPGEDACILNDDIARFHYGWLAGLHFGLQHNVRFAVAGPTGGSHTQPMANAQHGASGLRVVKHLPFWCALIRRTALDEIGLLDERYIHYASDNDWCDRARRAGWQCVWVRDVYLEHQRHGSGLRTQWQEHDHALYCKERH